MCYLSLHLVLVNGYQRLMGVDAIMSPVAMKRGGSTLYTSHLMPPMLNKVLLKVEF